MDNVLLPPPPPPHEDCFAAPPACETTCVAAAAHEHEHRMHQHLLRASAELEQMLDDLAAQQVALAEAHAHAEVQQLPSVVACVQHSQHHGRSHLHTVEAALVFNDSVLQALADAAADTSTWDASECRARTRWAACATAFARATDAVRTGCVCVQRMEAMAARATAAAAAPHDHLDVVLSPAPTPELLAQLLVSAPPDAAVQLVRALQHHPAQPLRHLDWPRTLHAVLASAPADKDAAAPADGDDAAAPADGDDAAAPACAGANPVSAERVAELLEAWPCCGGHWWPHADAARPDARGLTALMRACVLGNLACVRAVLECAPSRLGVNVCARGGWTALMLACRDGHVDVVTELLWWRRDVGRDGGASGGGACGRRRRGRCRRRRGEGRGRGCGGAAVDPTRRTKTGLDALCLAVAGGHVRVVQALLAHPAVQRTLNVSRAIDGMRSHSLQWHTPLSWACFTQREPVVDALLAFGTAHPHLLDVHVHVDTRGHMSRTALHIAVQTCSLRVVLALLQHAPPPAGVAFTGLAHALLYRRRVDAVADAVLTLPPGRLLPDEVLDAFCHACTLHPSMALAFLRLARDDTLNLRSGNVLQFICAVNFADWPGVLGALLKLPVERLGAPPCATAAILERCFNPHLCDAEQCTHCTARAAVAAAIAARRLDVNAVMEDGTTVAACLVRRFCTSSSWMNPRWTPGLVRPEQFDAASMPSLVRLAVVLNAPTDVVVACAQRCVDLGADWDDVERTRRVHNLCLCQIPLACLAMCGKRSDVLGCLLELRPHDAFVQDDVGFTALHYAVVQRDAQSVQNLLAVSTATHTPGAHIRNMNGQTALHLLRLSGGSPRDTLKIACAFLAHAAHGGNVGPICPKDVWALLIPSVAVLLDLTLGTLVYVAALTWLWLLRGGASCRRRPPRRDDGSQT